MVRQVSALYKFKDFVSSVHDNNDLLRVAFCYQIGSTFTVMSLVEDDIITYFLLCNNISVGKNANQDGAYSNELIEKLKILKSHTLGTLIKILSKNGVGGEGLNYLLWLKSRRDYFIHKFFDQHKFPGDMNVDELVMKHRQLCYLEAIFFRASHRVPRILQNANLVNIIESDGGFLFMNVDLFGD